MSLLQTVINRSLWFKITKKRRLKAFCLRLAKEIAKESAILFFSR